MNGLAVVTYKSDQSDEEVSLLCTVIEDRHPPTCLHVEPAGWSALDGGLCIPREWVVSVVKS